MRKIYKNLLPLLGLIVSLTFYSCEEEAPFTEGALLYLKSDIALYTNIAVDRVNNELINTPIQLPVYLTRPVGTDVDVSVNISADQELEDFKYLNKMYKYLPSSCFTLKSGNLTIKKGEIVSEGLSELVPSTDYFIANAETTPDYFYTILELTSFSAGDTGVARSTNANRIYCLFAKTRLYYSQEMVPGASAITERETWKFTTKPTAPTLVEYLIDKNNSTYLQLSSNGSLDIELINEEKLRGFSITPVYEAAFNIKQANVFVSTDKLNWTLVGEALLPIIKQGSSVENPDIRYVFFAQPTTSRYLRLSFTATYGSYAAIAELNIYK